MKAIFKKRNPGFAIRPHTPYHVSCSRAKGPLRGPLFLYIILANYQTIEFSKKLSDYFLLLEITVANSSRNQLLLRPPPCWGPDECHVAHAITSPKISLHSQLVCVVPPPSCEAPKSSLFFQLARLPCVPRALTPCNKPLGFNLTNPCQNFVNEAEIEQVKWWLTHEKYAKNDNQENKMGWHFLPKQLVTFGNDQQSSTI
jgi:hypothetical protein